MSDITKSEVQKIVKDEIKKFKDNTLDKEINNILKKNNSQSRKEMIDTIKNALESAFKVFWTKRDFWKTDIK